MCKGRAVRVHLPFTHVRKLIQLHTGIYWIFGTLISFYFAPIGADWRGGNETKKRKTPDRGFSVSVPPRDASEMRFIPEPQKQKRRNNYLGNGEGGTDCGARRTRTKVKGAHCAFIYPWLFRSEPYKCPVGGFRRRSERSTDRAFFAAHLCAVKKIRCEGDRKRRSAFFLTARDYTKK